MVLRMDPALRIVKAGNRDLAVEDAGPEPGFPVIVHNGTGSRHLFPPAVAEARDLGFRLIGYDRPGCGGSTAMPGRVIADSAADVQAIMSELGIAKMAAWGSSSGGPYALATAAKLAEAVTAVCLFASIGPYGMLAWTSPMASAAMPSARRSAASSKSQGGLGRASVRSQR